MTDGIKITSWKRWASGRFNGCVVEVTGYEHPPGVELEMIDVVVADFAPLDSGSGTSFLLVGLDPEPVADGPQRLLRAIRAAGAADQTGASGRLRRQPVRVDRGRGPKPKAATDYLGSARFGLLTFEHELPSREVARADGARFIRLGRFRCRCGGMLDAELRNVKRGLTRSCGCAKRTSE